MFHVQGKGQWKFDEEKETDRMVLSGWSAPEEKQINNNGENKQIASSSCAHATDDTIEDPSTKPWMKRKLGELLKIGETCDASSSAQLFGPATLVDMWSQIVYADSSVLAIYQLKLAFL